MGTHTTLADASGEWERWPGLLFAANPLPMWVWDAETLRFLDVNEAAVREYGFGRDEFLAMTVMEIRPSDDQAAFRDWAAATEPGPRTSKLWRHRRKDGSLLTAEVVAAPVTFRGRAARLDVAQNVSERERLNQEAHRSAELFQSVLDEMPVIVCVKDLERRMLFVNRAWERFVGIPREQAVGKTAHEILGAELAGTFCADDVEAIESSGPIATERVVPHEGVDRTHITSRSVLRDRHGKAEAIVGVAFDITDRKQAEAERARLSHAVEQAAESIVITDTRGTIVYVNPAFERVSGYTRAEVIGRNPRLWKSDRHERDFYRSLWSTLERGEVWQGRFTNRRKDGQLYDEEATISPVRNGGGAVANYVAVKRDLSAERRLEEQLLQSQKMEAVGRLAGGVAHDFNNILGVILGYSEMVRRGLPAGDPLNGRIEQIVRATERAAALTRQLLAFSRKQVQQPRILDLNTVVEDMGKMLRRLIGEDVQLVTILKEGLGRVKVDPGQLEQVIMNLAVNARDAMPRGGSLTIETRNVDLDESFRCADPELLPGPYVMLSMADTGIGMTSETLSHAFEPFFTTKEKGKGTGLGLSTVYGIVKQSAGHVEVKSSLGAGTTFEVCLPRVEAPAAREAAVAEGPLPGGTEAILLAEDEEAIRDLVKEILEERGYRVIAARCGASALEAAGRLEGPIQLVLTDVIMPGLSGRELADEIAVLHPGVRVLYMSGYTDDALGRHGVLEPGTALVLKPFSPGTLLRRVREVLDAPLA